MEHTTVYDSKFSINESDREYEYQGELTRLLDKLDTDFDQNTINQIVLWKVNRFAKIDNITLDLINSIDTESTIIDIDKTKIILTNLLKTKGIQLPMASTILRFKNNNIYQIIDQRVYRIITKEEKLKLSTYQNDKNIKEQIDLYISYLENLRAVCIKLNIPFNQSDRIFYMADKRINKDIRLDNY